MKHTNRKRPTVCAGKLAPGDRQARERREVLERFYRALDQNAAKRCSIRFAELDSLYSEPSMNKPGLYFLFEPCEYREDRKRLRVTYVGYASRLWARLKDHSDDSDRSQKLTDMFWAMARRKQPNLFDNWVKAGWRKPNVYWVDIKDDGDYETMRQLERKMLLPYVHDCSFTWLPAREEADHQNVTNWEKRVIALLSNRPFPEEAAIDRASPSWLGLHSPKPAIQQSGLWNDRHVNDEWTDDWLEGFEELVARV